MATISKSFTAVGVSSTLRVDAVGETINFALSGTYAATITFERATSFDETAWEIVPGSQAAGYAVANATVAFSFVTKRAKEKFRTRCIAFTSGTAVTSVADADALIMERRDSVGNLLETISQSGRSFIGNLFGRYTANSSDRPVITSVASTAASAALTASLTETIFSTGTLTIPANTLRAGSTITFRAQSIVTAANGTDTYQMKAYINGTGGTALATVTATDATANDIAWIEYHLTVRTIGTSGTIVGYGKFSSVPHAEGTLTTKDDILASTTLDTTAAVTIDITGKFSTTDPGNSARLDVFSAQVAI